MNQELPQRSSKFAVLLFSLCVAMIMLLRFYFPGIRPTEVLSSPVSSSSSSSSSFDVIVKELNEIKDSQAKKLNYITMNMINLSDLKQEIGKLRTELLQEIKSKQTVQIEEKSADLKYIVAEALMMTRDGFGAFMIHLIPAVAFAEYLNIPILFNKTEGSRLHQYNVASYLNGPIHPFPLTFPGEVVCKLSSFLDLPKETFLDKEHMMLLCDKNHGKIKSIASLWNPIPKKPRNCTVMSLDIRTPLMHERHYDCIQGWLQKKFVEVFSRINRTDLYSRYQVEPNIEAIVKHVNVGIHFRWGDTATHDVLKPGVRSVTIPQILTAMETIKKGLSSRYEIRPYLFMKNYNQTIAEFLKFNFTAIDSDDDIKDLFLLSKMDIYILGTGTFGFFSLFVEETTMVRKLIMSTIAIEEPYSKYFRQVRIDAKPEQIWPNKDSPPT